jgi:NAD(P)H-dependent FMN reductase
MVLVISSSLNPESKSRLLALEARRVLEEDGQGVSWLDLRETPPPLCDGNVAYDHLNASAAQALVEKAEAIILATPVYNYDASAAAKTLIELTGQAWEGKPVAFLCAAGGMSSYMSILSLANSLMLDFRCVIVPRFVYASYDAFADGRIADSDVTRRVREVARTTARFGRLLNAA